MLSVDFRIVNQRLIKEVEMRKESERQLMTLNQEMEIAKGKIEDINSKKTIYISDISHDLRAMVSSVISLSNIFRHNSQELGLPKKYDRFFNKLHAEGESTLLMLNNILDFSAFEIDSIAVIIEPVELDAWRSEINDLITPVAQLRDITVTFEVNPGGVTIKSDVLRLSQILLNLIHNTINVLPKCANIYVGMLFVDDRLKLVVRCDGDEMLAKDRQMISDMFSKEAKDPSHHSTTGLGLSILKRNIELLNGTISISDESFAAIEFVVMLPCARCSKI
jgi:signal transduction histidine kinase